MPDDESFSAFFYREIGRLNDKIDAAASKAELAFLSARVDNMVPRKEHEMRWKLEDERFAQAQETARVVGEVKANQLPKWVLPTLGLAATVVIAVLPHIWK